MSTDILKTNDIHDRIVCRRPCSFCLFAAQRAVGNKVDMEAAQTAVIQTMIPAVLVWQEFSAVENKLTHSIKGIPCKKSRTSCPAFLGRVPLFFWEGLQVGQAAWCAWPAKPRTEAARRRELKLKGGGGVHGFSVPCCQQYRLRGVFANRSQEFRRPLALISAENRAP